MRKLVICSLVTVTLFAPLAASAWINQVPAPREAIFSCSLPLALPVYVDSDGVFTTDDSVKIINSSTSAVQVVALDIKGVNGWEIIDYYTVFEHNKVNEKKVAISLQEEYTQANGAITFSQSRWPAIYSSGELALSYYVKVPAQVYGIKEQQVANITFIIDWAK